jgi:hypothetical protein
LGGSVWVGVFGPRAGVGAHVPPPAQSRAAPPHTHTHTTARQTRRCARLHPRVHASHAARAHARAAHRLGAVCGELSLLHAALAAHAVHILPPQPRLALVARHARHAQRAHIHLRVRACVRVRVGGGVRVREVRRVSPGGAGGRCMHAVVTPLQCGSPRRSTPAPTPHHTHTHTHTQQQQQQQRAYQQHIGPRVALCDVVVRVGAAVLAAADALRLALGRVGAVLAHPHQVVRLEGDQAGRLELLRHRLEVLWQAGAAAAGGAAACQPRQGRAMRASPTHTQPSTQSHAQSHAP